MEERKNFLARLKNSFGECNRKSFLQKLLNWFNSRSQPQQNFQTQQNKPQQNFQTEETFEEDKESSPTESTLPAPTLKILDINGTDALRSHVEQLKNLSILYDFISESQNLFENNNKVKPFIKIVSKSLNDIKNFVDKNFKESMDIDEDASEIVADRTGKLFKDNFGDLFRSCHNGIKYNQGEEKKFYESFHDVLEKYLSSIGVYRKNITEGMDIDSNSKWFEPPIIRESSLNECIGKIDEIERFPYFILYRDDNGKQDEKILKGVCITFGESKKGVN